MRTIKSLLLIMGLSLSFNLFAKQLEWTFMVYMAADNNLHFDALDDLKQMAQVGSSERVKFIVFHDTLDPETSTKIYEIGHEDIKIIKDYERNVDSGDWQELVDFFKFSSKSYPAQKMGLTIWNHGSGWDKKRAEGIDKGIAYDDHSNNKITTVELGKALRLMSEFRGSTIDLVATDACLMQTIEVAYEISPYAQYYAASQEVEPYTGWPYDVIYKELIASETLLPENLAKLIADSYVNGIDAPSWSKTFSVIRLSSLGRLLNGLGSLNQYLSAGALSRQELVELIRKAQTFSDAETVDLKDFLRLIAEASTLVPLHQVLKEIQKASEEAIFYNAHKGNSVSRANGLSLWAPPWAIENDKFLRYFDLAFHKQTQWGSLIRYLYP